MYKQQFLVRTDFFVHEVVVFIFYKQKFIVLEDKYQWSWKTNANTQFKDVIYDYLYCSVCVYIYT